MNTYNKTLTEWVSDPFASLPWNAEQVAKRIREAGSSGKLDLSQMLMMQMPREVWQLTSLSELVLAGEYKFKAIPPEIFNMRGLTLLNLSFNEITSLPPEIGLLTHLRSLVFERNQISLLPTELGQLSQLTCLDLYDNQIAHLPTEIGRLKNLKLLILESNPLRSIPSEIGGMTLECFCVPPVTDLPRDLPNLKQLTYDQYAFSETLPVMTRLTCLTLNRIVQLPPGVFLLTHLSDLKLNSLSELPAAIGRLTALTTLDLSNSALAALPDTIGQLGRLTKLNLANNQFSLFPQALLQLTSLRKLNVSLNRLTMLPVEIGNLRDLEKLDLSYNPLTTLPLSLGQIAGLTHLEGDGCLVDSFVWLTIRDQCRLIRDSEADVAFPVRFEKWKALAECRRLVLGELAKRETIALNEWLLRLEKTRDFAHDQKALAATVCAMLHDVFTNPAFKELFFAQVEANNESCEDRAAMAFNEIYTSWKVVCGNGGLEMMKGVAKTLALRKELQKLLRNSGERESVEIFLFYEILLKEELGLVTAFSSMTYATIGERAWIDKERLIRAVKDNYFDELYALPVFQKRLQENGEVRRRWEEIDQKYRTELDGLGDEEDLDLQHKKAEIMLSREREKKEVAASCI